MPKKVRSQERKFQLDVGGIHVSLIAHSEKHARKEFLLATFETVAFLAVEAGGAQELQLRISYF